MLTSSAHFVRFVRPWHQRYRPLYRRDLKTAPTLTHLLRHNKRQLGIVQVSRFHRTRTAAYPCLANNNRIEMAVVLMPCSKVLLLVMRHLRVLLHAHPVIPSISHLSIRTITTTIITRGTYLITRRPK